MGLIWMMLAYELTLHLAKYCQLARSELSASVNLFGLLGALRFALRLCCDYSKRLRIPVCVVRP